MKQRIQELAEQAFDKANNGTISDIKIPKEFIEKFAELIVRECEQVVLAVPCYYKDYRDQIEAAVISDCAIAVLEHFGVEE
jgi:hypothetical protein